MALDDRYPHLGMLLDVLKSCEPLDDGAPPRLEFRREPPARLRGLLDAAGIVLSFDRQGDSHWVTAEMDDATVMVPLDGEGRQTPVGQTSPAGA